MTTTWRELGYLTPELVVLLGAAAVLLLDLFLPRGRRRVLGGVALVPLGVALGWVLRALWAQSGGPSQLHKVFGALLLRDPYSLGFDVVFLVAAILGVLLSLRYVEREALPAGEYYALTLFAVFGMMMMAMSAELITLFISYEILSLAVYVLAGIARGRAVSAEASLKYFLLGAFASGFLVYGIALVYGATGTTVLYDPLGQSASTISGLILERGLFGNALLLAGLALLVVGIAFKAAIVPFHAWVPDVYEGAPLPVTAFMSAGVKAAAFAAFARLLFGGFRNLGEVWQPVLWVLAVLTMVLGNAAAIRQQNVKRMLAYSSIAHAGYLLVALAAYTARDVAIGSVLYYALTYTAMGVGAFAILLVVGQEGEANQELSDYRGLASRHPWAAAAMGLFMISLAGFPLTAGFLGKFYILNAALRADLDGLAVVLGLASVVSWYYYLRVVWFMYMTEVPKAAVRPISRATSLGVAVAVAALLVIALGVFPSTALAVAQMAGHTLLPLGY
ncbi:MAG: NADH-quinone oxidoreductase subunit N [Armatimonadetes bacterium]|nr:NADH-quinone oxidoreductase subunit N [Armatimonadota bacterium]